MEQCQLLARGGTCTRHRALLPSPPWWVPSLLVMVSCVFLSPRAGTLPISDSFLGLVPFLSPPHSFPSHHLSGRNTRASTAPRGIAGSLTFSPCFFSQHRLKQMEEPGFGGVALPWLLVCRVERKEHPCTVQAGAAGLLERAIPCESPVPILCVKC